MKNRFFARGRPELFSAVARAEKSQSAGSTLTSGAIENRVRTVK